ncbi:DNA repair-scaffolding protein isoform X1 [Poecilia formosa]|uniref:DNA repair-scaffolding protein isoform X1 n=2 Tax=Poecilia formosa TaxID=48698 RepID=UPI0007B7FD98|nr:PREDICTED: DNA repair-scaffolding protein isoform X1 [Poecilia formosa]
MSSRKRKRLSKDIKCLLFPADAVESGPQKRERETASLLSSRSWATCGDSFLGTPNLQSGKKLRVKRKLVHTPASVQSSAPSHDEDPVDIAWSSSETEPSDDESQVQRMSKVALQQRPRPPMPRRPNALIQSYTTALSVLTNEKDDLPVIETDSDLDQSEEDDEKDSGQQISDCGSDSADESTNVCPLDSEHMKELEISGYVSDGDDLGCTLTSSKLDSDVFSLQSGEGSKKSVRDWLTSAQAMLQTPQKPMDRQFKTPEGSTKKKRKFKSGGLAERLNRLHCRQRSAISFWRHKSISDTSVAAATTVDRPGVLVLEVLEVHEESSMQLAHCEHQQPPRDGHQERNAVSEETTRMLVLFNRETAAQLIPAPGDVIHIYPPWQSLSIEGFICPVILSTHFSQKVSSASKPDDMSLPKIWLSAERRLPYFLGQIFGLLDECKTKSEGRAKQVAASDVLCTFGTRPCLSLLEAIEGLGQAGNVDQDVDVVVQRVYSVPMADCSPVSFLKHRASLRSSTAPPTAEKGKTRLCVLVQDSFGIFSTVRLQPLSSSDELHQYCQMWQGRTCVLRGVKVVERVTRERHSRLFSLIDSLWPPATSLKDHGNSLSILNEIGSPGPPPSFCYLLSGHQSSVEPREGQTVSPLYLHPASRTLRDILRSEAKSCRCSFIATVLYKRMQSTDVGQGEVWLVLTDPSLQEEQPERPCRRTVALCVSTSCVLTSSVLEALNSPAVCDMSFRDAIREHGVLLCAEQSVIEVSSVQHKSSFETTTRQDSLSSSEPQVKTLPQPPRLDSLSLETTPNSLCSLTGVIVGVDENTAYSWPACNLCGSDNLEVSAEKPQNFHCISCKSTLDKPDTKVQLEVFLSSSSLGNCTLKVKLQQKTVMLILNTPVLESSEARIKSILRDLHDRLLQLQGYDVESVLGKEVGPLAVYVRVVTRKPALWMGLEEICLQAC